MLKNGLKKLKKRYSDFWVDANTKRKLNRGKQLDIYELAAIKRSISDFVYILTDRKLPVKFNDNDDGPSFTDGSSVVISSNITPNNFDSTVGLALHEASHIVKTEFYYIHQLADYYDEIVEGVPGNVLDEKVGTGIIPKEIWDKALQNKEHKNWVPIAMKQLLNYIEDRRIDQWSFDGAPGYKGYYHALYDRYWNSEEISDALQSNEKRELDWDSYFFRIINLTNPNTDLDALPNLRKIAETIDLNNIRRLKSTKDVWDVTIEVMHILLDTINNPQELQEMRVFASGGGGGEGEPIDLGELSQAEKDALEKAIKQQKKFLEGDIDKEALDASQNAEISAIEEVGTSQVDVGEGYGMYGKIKCVVVNRLNYSLIKNNNFDCLNYNRQTNTSGAVSEGIRIGRQLGRKLKVRSEKRSTEYKRRKHGKMDGNLLAEIGFNDRIFSMTEIDEYNEGFIHISVDASSSMNGDKWRKAVLGSVAIAQAASMIDNIRVQISFRSTCGKGYYNNDSKPLIIIAYDSNRDKIGHIKTYFPFLSAGGTTPEGLSFEAIMDEIYPDKKNMDAYFLNLSDGLPYYKNRNPEFRYSGNAALQHTRNQIKKIKDMGFKVLSYYITEGTSVDMTDFKQMYGRDAAHIDMTNIHQIANTMNKKFLEKS